MSTHAVTRHRDTRPSCGRWRDRFTDEVINGRDLDGALTELVAEDFVEQNPLPGQGPGRAGLADVLAGAVHRIPRHALDDPTPSSRATHHDPVDLDRHPPRRVPRHPRHRARVRVEAWTIDRYRHGQLVESRIIMDVAGLLVQLGVHHPPRPAEADGRDRHVQRCRLPVGDGDRAAAARRPRPGRRAGRAGDQAPRAAARARAPAAHPAPDRRHRDPAVRVADPRLRLVAVAGAPEEYPVTVLPALEAVQAAASQWPAPASSSIWPCAGRSSAGRGASPCGTRSWPPPAPATRSTSSSSPTPWTPVRSGPPSPRISRWPGPPGLRLLDPPDTIRRKVSRAVTDSGERSCSISMKNRAWPISSRSWPPAPGPPHRRRRRAGLLP